MTKPLQLPSPLEGDTGFRMLGRLTGRLDNTDLSALMVFLIDTVNGSTLPWLGEQSSLSGDGWEPAESDDARRMLVEAAIELHRYKGVLWLIQEATRRLDLGEVDLIEGTGRLSYDGSCSCNGLLVHGDIAAWVVYHIILKQPIVNDQAAMLRQTPVVSAPARCHPVSLEC